MPEINKVDAAISHCMAAIHLYFNDGPAASTHILAATSLDICEVFLKETDFEEFTFSNVIYKTNVTDIRKAWKLLRDVQNELKHADRDKNTLITINCIHTEILLYYASILIDSTTLQKKPTIDDNGEFERFCYVFWFKIKNESSKISKADLDIIKTLGVPLPQEGYSKLQFYEWTKQRKKLYLNFKKRIVENILSYPEILLEAFKDIV